MAEPLVLSGQQEKAVKLGKEWWNNNKGVAKPSPFIVSGQAGTGKSTIAWYIIDLIGIPIDRVAALTFSAKASSVLVKKGLPGRTLHSFFYRVEEIKETRNGKTFYSIKYIKRSVEELRSKASLILIDEVSMVPTSILDLAYMSGIPCIFLGDDGQLPAISEPNDVLTNPDIVLTEIHRNAKDSMIVLLATAVRNGKLKRTGNRFSREGANDCASIIPLSDIDVDEFDFLINSADQILCAKNKTRMQINERYRTINNYTSKYPEEGEKLICLKNNNNTQLSTAALRYLHSDLPLSLPKGYSKTTLELLKKMKEDEVKSRFYEMPMINGILMTCLEDARVSTKSQKVKSIKNPKMMVTEERDELTINLKPDFAINQFELFDDVEFSVESLTNGVYNYNLVKNMFDRKYKRVINEDHLTWGYAITTHKAQGSEFSDVCIYEEVLGYATEESHRKWLYTSITRAVENVTLISAQ
jgi:exodeoxyribonuclease-5